MFRSSVLRTVLSRTAPLLSLLATALVVSCGSSLVHEASLAEYLQEHPDTVGEVAFGLWRGCPSAGTPAVALVPAFGRPRRTSIVDGTQTWGYGIEGGRAELVVRLTDGVVADWGVHAAHGALSTADVRTDRQTRERVERYRRDHGGTDGKTLYAMLRRCVLVGMTGAQVRAAHGTPTSVAEPPGDAGVERWVYAVGFEGQRLEIELSSGTVAGWRYVDSAHPRR